MNQAYRGKSVFITGVTGFIGARLAAQLLSLGAVIHASSRHKGSGRDSAYNWYTGDLSDPDFVNQVITACQPDYIFHLASEVTGSREVSAVRPTLTSNLLSTINLLEATTRINCKKLVITGSLEEPDLHDPDQLPCSPYAAAKWSASGYARMFHALYQTPVCIARLFMVYGPGQKDLKKLVPYVILSLLKGEIPELASGERPVDWVFVDDVVDGFIAMGLAENVAGQSVELGTGHLTTTGEVAKILCRIDGQGLEPSLGIVAERALEQVRTANVENTSAILDWKPKYSVEQGLQLTYEWYKQELENGNLVDPSA